MKTKTTKIFIIVTTLAVIAIGFYVYAAFYIIGLTRKTADLKQDISNLEITYQHAESLRMALEGAAGQKDKINSYFIPSNGAIDFVARLEHIANNLGLKYDTRDIIQKQDDDLGLQNKEFLQVKFSAIGSWTEIMNLLKTVESLPYALRIDKADLSSSDVPSSSRWQLDVTLSVVKIKDK